MRTKHSKKYHDAKTSVYENGKHSVPWLHMILWYCHNAFVRKSFFFLVLKTKRNDFSFGRLNTSMHVISDEESVGILRADGVR